MGTITEEVSHKSLVNGSQIALHTHPGGAALPAGLICMWSGLLSNIPAGWALCDGQSGRPDLRERFIKGAAPGVDPGGTGGSATHTHADHPALSHSGTDVASHAAAPTTQASAGATQRGTNASTLTLLAHTHNTPVLAHSVTQPAAHAAQGHDTPNSEPPYFALAFIILV